MLPIQQFTPAILAEILKRQPSSAARTRFAWQLAVGPALARATTVELVDGTLCVRAADPRWIGELTRAKGVVLARLQHLLGPGEVTRIRT
jgi:predicted nucleic acid-binding Zn ribbon protein